MTLRTHDLVLFRATPYALHLPAWTDRVDGDAWGVVRRAAPRAGHAALGLRGRQRAERVAVDVHRRDVLRVVPPETLVDRPLSSHGSPGIARTLEVLATRARTVFGGRAWGPTGSVGFQLATGLHVVRATSDLDLLVRAPDRMTRAAASGLLAFLRGLPCRVDCLVETPRGAVALAEWASVEGGDVLLRTVAGPVQTLDPWAGTVAR